MAFTVLKKKFIQAFTPDGLSAANAIGWSDIANADGTIPVPLSWDPEVYTYYVAVDLTAGTEYTFSSAYNPNLQLYLNGSKVANNTGYYDESTGSEYYLPLSYTPAETGQYILYCGGNMWGDLQSYTLTASPAVSGNTAIPAHWITATELDAAGKVKRYGSADEAGISLFYIPAAGLVFYAPLIAGAAAAATGQTLSTNGTIAYSTVDGVPCAHFNADAYISSTDLTNLPTGGADRTLSIWAKLASDTSSRSTLICYGKGQNNFDYTLEINEKKLFVSGGGSTSNESYGAAAFDVTQWHHLASVYKSGTVYFYVDGAASGSFVWNYNTTETGNIWLSSTYGTNGATEKYLSAARIYNRALDVEEIALLSKEFNAE